MLHTVKPQLCVDNIWLSQLKKTTKEKQVRMSSRPDFVVIKYTSCIWALKFSFYSNIFQNGKVNHALSMRKKMENAHIKIKLPCTVPANGSNSQFQQQHPTAWLHASCSLCIVFVSPFVPRQTARWITINRCATVQVLYKIIPSTIICIGVTLLYAQHNSLQLELIFLDGNRLLCIEEDKTVTWYLNSLKMELG